MDSVKSLILVLGFFSTKLTDFPNWLSSVPEMRWNS